MVLCMLWVNSDCRTLVIMLRLLRFFNLRNWWFGHSVLVLLKMIYLMLLVNRMSGKNLVLTPEGHKLENM